jgi:hypothetical protein
VKLDPDFVRHREITVDDGRLFAGRVRSSRCRDVIVGATLLALFVVAIATRAAISNEIGDGSVDRQGHVALVIGVAASVALSIGLALLLLFRRRRAGDEGARS